MALQDVTRPLFQSRRYCCQFHQLVLKRQSREGSGTSSPNQVMIRRASSMLMSNHKLTMHKSSDKKLTCMTACCGNEWISESMHVEPLYNHECNQYKATTDGASKRKIYVNYPMGSVSVYGICNWVERKSQYDREHCVLNFTAREPDFLHHFPKAEIHTSTPKFKDGVSKCFPLKKALKKK